MHGAQQSGECGRKEERLKCATKTFSLELEDSDNLFERSFFKVIIEMCCQKLFLAQMWFSVSLFGSLSGYF